MDRKRFLVIVLSFLVITIYAIALVPKEFQNDTFFTIAIGKRIQKYGVEQEEMLVWHDGLEFTNPRWLFDLIISIIYDSFGLTGIYVFVCVFSAVLALLFYAVSKSITCNQWLSFFATLLILSYIAGCFTGRSLLLSFILFLLEFYCLEKITKNEKYKRYTICLIILPFILVNIHASLYLVYFIIFLPYIADAIINKIFVKYHNDSKLIIGNLKNIFILMILLIIGLIAGFCVPHGVTPFSEMFNDVNGMSDEFIAELQETSVIKNYVFTFLLIVPIAIIAFSKTKVRLTDCLFILGFALMSMAAVRCIYFFYTISLICIMRIVNDFFNEYQFNFDFISRKYKIAIIAFICIITILHSINLLMKRTWESYIDDSKYPVDATEYILNNIDVSSMKIYNHFNFGSYLEFKGIPVFIDSRSGIYTPEFNPGTSILEDWHNVVSGKESYKKIFNKYDITHALLYNGEVANLYIVDDPEWKQIYKDNAFSLYEKVSR